MPTVPVRTPRVGPSALPNVRLNPNAPIEAFGGGITAKPLPDLGGASDALARIGTERDRVRREEANRANQVATTSAYGTLVTGTNDILHGNDGVLNRRGKDAFTADADAYDRFGALEKSIRDGLTNDDQRAAFDKMVIHEWSQTDSQIQPHIARQRQAYDTETTKAAVTASQNQAAANYGDEGLVNNAVAAQQALISDHLKRQGAPDEQITNAKADVASKTRVAVIQQFLNNDQDQTAATYFAKYKQEITGKDLNQAEKLIDAGLVRGESQRHADIITGTFHSLTDAIEQTKTITDPRIRDETEQRIRRHFNDVAADLRQQREQSFYSLSSQLEQNGGNVDRLKTSPAWLSVTPQDHNALERRANLMRHPDEGPGDQEQFMALSNEAYFDPEAFASRNILNTPGLSAKQKQHLQTMQRTVGAHVQRTDEAEIVKGMKATQKAGFTSPDSATTSALGDDPALNASLGIGPKVPASTHPDAPHPGSATSAPAQPAHAATPIVALTPIPKTQATPQMLQDILKKGPRYAEYLRSMNVDVPDVIPVQPPAAKQP